MSESDPRLSASPAPRRLALTVLMIVAGIVLLLPGLCSLAFIVVLSGEGLAGLFDDPGLLGLWAVCFAITAGGIVLILRAWRGRGAT